VHRRFPCALFGAATVVRAMAILEGAFSYDPMFELTNEQRLEALAIFRKALGSEFGFRDADPDDSRDAQLKEALRTAEIIAQNLSVPEAARYTGLSEAFLNRLRSVGGGSPFYKVGTRVLYNRSDLDHWLASRKRVSTADDGTAA
jgi:excisionase family DNA binding protein